MPKNQPLQYIARTKEWYEGLGYGEPYQWAQFEEVPFCRLRKPLSDSTVGLVTTAALYHADKGNQGPGASYNAAAKFYSVYSQSVVPDPDVRISHIAYDRAHTSAKDKNTWFPLRALQQLAKDGVIGKVANQFFGLPTNRSQRHTVEIDCVSLYSLMRGIDVAVLVANCPVCHQSVSLAARHLERHGITTVVMGCAKDIVENVGVPRLFFSDFPLGNAAGKPFDQHSQSMSVSLALDMVEQANAPRTTVHSPLVWSKSHKWKEDYSNIAKLSIDEIRSRRAEFDRQKSIAKQQRQSD